MRQATLPVRTNGHEGDDSVVNGKDPAMSERRSAVRELGAALRELNEAAVSSEVDTETLREVAAQARELVAPLTAASRDRFQLAAVDEGQTRGRYFNPAIGPGNPFAPPLKVGMVDDVAEGTCTLGLAYEGPPSYVHGGVSAMLLDQILGHAHAATTGAGMTVRLSMRYRKPVPLQTPLRVRGWVVRDGSERPESKATVTTAHDPDTVLVEATGAFIVPRPDQIERLFGGTRSASGFASD